MLLQIYPYVYHHLKVHGNLKYLRLVFLVLEGDTMNRTHQDCLKHLSITISTCTHTHS